MKTLMRIGMHLSHLLRQLMRIEFGNLPRRYLASIQNFKKYKQVLKQISLLRAAVGRKEAI
jgi:hypothetical protein